MCIEKVLDECKQAEEELERVIHKLLIVQDLKIRVAEALRILQETKVLRVPIVEMKAVPSASQSENVNPSVHMISAEEGLEEFDSERGEQNTTRAA